MGRPDRAKLWQAALFGYWLLLFVATHLPREFPGLPGEGKDKWAHFGAFAVLAWLMAMTWERSTGRLRAAHLVSIWILLALYAAADEITQMFAGRTTSFADWTADMVGAVAGLVAFVATRRLVRS